MIDEFERRRRPDVLIFEGDLRDEAQGMRRYRVSRWYEVNGSNGTPFIMWNSGRETHSGGSRDMRQTMMDGIQDAAAEAAVLRVQAWSKRTDNQVLQVQADITNILETEFDPWSNNGRVVILGVENTQELFVKKTLRFVEEVDFDAVIEAGGTAQIDANVTVTEGRTNFNRLDVAVFVDYQDDEGWDIAGGTLTREGERPAAPPTPTATPMPEPVCELSPRQTTGTVQEQVSINASVTAGESPVVGASVRFEVIDGPSTGGVLDAETNEQGEVPLIYSAPSAGTDVIQASGEADGVAFDCGQAEVIWEADEPEPTATPPPETDGPQIYLPALLSQAEFGG